MLIIKGFDEQALKAIAKKADNKQLVKDVSYLRTVNFFNPEKLYCERLDDVAFFCGSKNSDHFRIIGIGVRADKRGNGYGKFMLYRAIQYAKKYGYKKIRTKTFSGVDFYQKWAGAKIIDWKDGDFILEFFI